MKLNLDACLMKSWQADGELWTCADHQNILHWPDKGGFERARPWAKGSEVKEKPEGGF